MTHAQAPWKFVEEYYIDDLAERDAAETKFYLSWLKHVKGKNVLCLGCGPNLYDDLQFFLNFPSKIIGVDINKNNIEFLKKSQHPEIIKCRELLLKNKVKTELLVWDILKLKREFIGKFDVVYAIGVIGMFKEEQLKNLLKLIHNYLKPKGVFLDVDWTDCQLSQERYNKRRNYKWYSKEGPSIKNMGRLITQKNFKIIRHKVYDVPNKKEYGWGKIYGYLAQK